MELQHYVHKADKDMWKDKEWLLHDKGFMAFDRILSWGQKASLCLPFFLHIVACRPAARQQPQHKQIYNNVAN
jgi:hypothetical protein